MKKKRVKLSPHPHPSQTLGTLGVIQEMEIAHLFHKISFNERLIFCRICEFGCDGAGPEPPRRPEAGVRGTEAPTSFLPDPGRAAGPSSFLEDVGVPGARPALLAVGALPVAAAEVHGFLGMVPGKTGVFLTLGLVVATFTNGDFFGRRVLGKGALLPAEEPEGAALLGTAAATVSFSSTCRSSFVAARRGNRLSSAMGLHVTVPGI